MTSLSPLQIHRRMFGTPGDGMAAYWYLGMMSVVVEDGPPIPVIQAETVMVYKATTLSDDAYTLQWWEIGVMRDPVTGEIARDWTNPITGAVLPTSRKFEEGPATFTITAAGEGLKIDLIQAHAKVIGVDVTIRTENGRVFLEQIERKFRGLPRPDGSFPEPGEPGSVEARTRLSIWASLADLESSPYPFSSGSYGLGLDLQPWMGFGDRKGHCVIEGVMRKAGMREKLNPIAWERLKAEFPERFEGEELRPAWF
jgi:hypothetical protein